MKKRLVVGMSGASGAILGIELLSALKNEPEWETHLVISRGAEVTISQETDYALETVRNLADQVHPIEHIGASIASGTFQTEGMVIVPCSMKTLAGVVTGYSDNLLLRAADVVIKEQRKLVLVARETPLSPIHLRNMLTLADQGVVIMPPMPAYYNHPINLEDVNRHMIGKILGKFGVSVQGFKSWQGM